LLDQVSEPGLFLDTVPEVRLAERLQEFGLLPDENRRKFVATVSEYALSGRDGDALNDAGIRRLFSDAEFDELLYRARTELLPRLSEVRREWQSDHRSSDPPDEHMQQLLELFDALKERFCDDSDAATIIDREIGLANEWIGENTPDESEKSSRKLGKVEGPTKPHSSRSIFDDIDADEHSEMDAAQVPAVG
jgi:hypothetical protein